MKINPEPEQKQLTTTEVLRMTQKDWIDYFNRPDMIKKNISMISVPNVYNAKGEKVIASLRDDFKKLWLVTSTQIIYNKDNLLTTIIHNTGSKNKKVKPKIYKDILIPVLNGDFENNKDTEKYLQALFDTEDNLDTIIAKIKKISGKETIRLWTPDQSSRASRPVRSVCLYCDVFGSFFVFGDGWSDGVYFGFSRRVLSDSEPKARSKKR